MSLEVFSGSMAAQPQDPIGTTLKDFTTLGKQDLYSHIYPSAGIEGFIL